MQHNSSSLPVHPFLPPPSSASSSPIMMLPFHQQQPQQQQYSNSIYGGFMPLLPSSINQDESTSSYLSGAPFSTRDHPSEVHFNPDPESVQVFSEDDDETADEGGAVESLMLMNPSDDTAAADEVSTPYSDAANRMVVLATAIQPHQQDQEAMDTSGTVSVDDPVQLDMLSCSDMTRATALDAPSSSSRPSSPSRSSSASLPHAAPALPLTAPTASNSHHHVEEFAGFILHHRSPMPFASGTIRRDYSDSAFQVYSPALSASSSTTSKPRAGGRSTIPKPKPKPAPAASAPVPAPSPFSPAAVEHDDLINHNNPLQQDEGDNLQISESHTPSAAPANRSSDNKVYACSSCSKVFMHRGSLWRHSRVHLPGTNKVHECKFCSAKFAQKTTLINHQRIHLGERPFECKTCGKHFTQSGNLKRHMKRSHAHSDHERKAHRCLICCRAFTTKWSLIRHINSDFRGHRHP